MTQHQELTINFQGQTLTAYVRVYLTFGQDAPPRGYIERPEYDWTLLDLRDENGELPHIFYETNRVELDGLIEDKLWQIYWDGVFLP